VPVVRVAERQAVETMSTAGRGRHRERQVAERLRSEGWVVLKGTSFGVCDLAAMRAGDTPLLVEVKANQGSPYMNFRGEEREVLALEARRAGARAVLAWWPPRRPLRLIPSSEWPS
jgi:Holliday junction resolvase